MNVDVCGLGYVDEPVGVDVCRGGCMRSKVGAPTPGLRNDLQNDPQHLQRGPLVYSLFMRFAVPATRSIGCQRTRTAGHAVIKLMHPDNARFLVVALTSKGKKVVSKSVVKASKVFVAGNVVVSCGGDLGVLIGIESFVDVKANPHGFDPSGGISWFICEVSGEGCLDLGGLGGLRVWGIGGMKEILDLLLSYDTSMKNIMEHQGISVAMVMWNTQRAQESTLWQIRPNTITGPLVCILIGTYEGADGYLQCFLEVDLKNKFALQPETNIA
ncbi:hypothetical protein OG21DRAFT_1524147 [Imleria badia]|nr:hypothetical protein OG21DRAFT_1524147 [Imleria badia]